jgi:hypothetical protein
MPRKKNLDLAAELGEDVDVTETEAAQAAEIVAPAPVPVPVAPAQTFTMTAESLQGMITAAVQAAAQGNQALADAVTAGIAATRKPIPEGTDASNPRISVLNPLGDRDHPRPTLRCEYFLGTFDAKTQQVQRTYPYLTDDLTVQEVIALNTLEPITTTLDFHGIGPTRVSVVPERDAVTNEIRRMVITLPVSVTGKNSTVKNMLPGPCGLVAQITGRDFSKLQGEDLAWFMAEHRAGRYVTEREAVAA